MATSMPRTHRSRPHASVFITFVLLSNPLCGFKSLGFCSPSHALWQVSIVGIGHEFKTFDGEDVQQYIDLMDKDEIAEAPADAAMQE